MITQIIERQATQTINPFSGAAATASAIPQADNPLAASDVPWQKFRPLCSSLA